MVNPMIFQGVHAVLFALFRADETLDHDAMAAQVDYCIDKGCHGITVLGLATEVLKLTLPERLALIESVGRAVGGRVSYSVTVAGNSVAEQVTLCRAAQEAGADWLILQPPMSGNFGADVYLEFFARIAEQTNLPVALQNAPQYLGLALSGDDIARLRQRCPNVVAVKSEDAALGVQNIIATAGAGIHVLGGRGGLELTDNLRNGCEGFVLAPDIAPVAARVFDLWQKGEHETAETLYAAMLPEITFVMQSLEHLITYGKRVFGVAAGLPIHDRAPCLPPSPQGLKLMQRWARHLQGLDAPAQ
ncbi:hypothetical protein A9320_11105 [Ruegeria sp. PBVC088]|nr:hypothetical protein A9320_11105 [Ruegeria sp. PBVC088]